MSDAMPCRLCGGATEPLFSLRVLDKHDVRYFRCRACELVETEPPHWLDEAYAQALAALDTGALVRNQVCARLTLAVALSAGVGDRPCLDFGGAHGVLTRMLRDFGLDFRRSDRYAENLYARGFDGDVTERYALVTAFEVLEHFADVAGELERLFAPRHDLVLVGTELHEGPPRDWWYLTPESGQHIAFYSGRTMQHIAARFGYRALVGAQYTLFVRADLPLPAWRRALLAGVLRAPLVAYAVAALVPDPVLLKLGPFRSRTLVDHETLRARSEPPAEKR